MNGTESSPRRVFGIAAVLVAGALLVAGCAATAAKPTPTTSPSTASSPPPVSSPTPTPSTPVTTSWTPFQLACSRVMTANQVYAYNSNYVADTGYVAATGSLASTIVSNQGTSCGWIDETSSTTFGVAIGEPTPSELAAEKKLAAAQGTAVPGYSGTAYFSSTGGVGVAQAFTGHYWVVISSGDFGVPGDAVPVLTPVLKNLAGH